MSISFKIKLILSNLYLTLVTRMINSTRFYYNLNFTKTILMLEGNKIIYTIQTTMDKI